MRCEANMHRLNTLNRTVFLAPLHLLLRTTRRGALLVSLPVHLAADLTHTMIALEKAYALIPSTLASMTGTLCV